MILAAHLPCVPDTQVLAMAPVGAREYTKSTAVARPSARAHARAYTHTHTHTYTLYVRTHVY